MIRPILLSIDLKQGNWTLVVLESFQGKYDMDLESPSNFQIKEKKLFKSVHKQGNWTFVVLTVIWRKYNIGF